MTLKQPLNRYYQCVTWISNIEIKTQMFKSTKQVYNIDQTLTINCHGFIRQQLN